MPANETTWRDTMQLHRIFAVTGVLLTIGTVWMFWKDHARSWKTYQVNANEVDLKMNDLRQLQYQTGEADATHRQRAGELAVAKARPIDEGLLAKFKSEVTTLNQVLERWKRSGHAYDTVSFDERKVDDAAKSLPTLADDAKNKRAAADAAETAADSALAAAQSKPDDETALKALADAKEKFRDAAEAAAAAEQKAANVRAGLAQELFQVVDTARMKWEEKALGIRKFKNGEIDAAKANIDIAIRDNLPPEELAAREATVNELVGDMAHPDQEAEAGKDTFAALNVIYQTISKARKDLERTYKLIQAELEAAQKAFDESLADLDRLKKQEQDRSEKVFTIYDYWPFVLGKKILTLPIVDAFNSPRKIENLWSDGLMQNYNFSYVRRFDRCTTCHQSLGKTLPGTSTSPAFVHEERFELVVIPPRKEEAPKPTADENGKLVPPNLGHWLGLRLASEGLLNRDDITVALVLPKTPAAKAQIVSTGRSGQQATGREIRQAAAQVSSSHGDGVSLFPTLPGLMVGDVIEGIGQGSEPIEPLQTSGGDRTPKRIAARLIALAEDGKPIRLAVRRGMPNPYVSHPRLDLYVSDASPHRLQTFACTVCHDGQGSSTSFEWASHTPSTVLDMERWTNEHGWFDNPHWIYPMYAKRFAEAACLKCHHDVVELEPSEKFADAPAPKVTHGYHIVRKYGCYGCHEVNGFDGPTRRVGPDLRSEPNYFAVAQQIEAELVAAGRGPVAGEAPVPQESLKDWKAKLDGLTSPVVAHPEDGEARLRLKATIDEAVAGVGTETTRLDRTLSALANMLKDVEAPGSLRRPGPSLRFIASKSDAAFLYDWIANPQHFRPTTRMPRFFGLWNHLQDSHGKMTDEKAPKLEPIEIRGVLAYFESYQNDQAFEPEAKPRGIGSWTSEEKLARGKTQFQTRGCLACHTHKDFPDVQKFRTAEEIVQGPDLSGIGDKFAKERNPKGPDWLYSWIKNPTKYHARTVMPNLFLDPEKDAGANPTDTSDDKWFDPADDIVSYLLSSTVQWQPIPEAAAAGQPIAEDDPALKQLMLEHLNEAFYKDVADEYYTLGIPPHLEGELKGAEKDLIVRGGPDRRLTNQQRLKYIGRKTIAKYGCFGCHDIPGFEDAKPIGTGLADWGRKDAAKLAFEHIAHYIEHGHGSAAHGSAAHRTTQPHGAESKGGVYPGEDRKSKTSSEALYADSTAKSNAADPTAVDRQPMPTPAESIVSPESHSVEESDDFKSFYTHALEAGNRIGFIYQKLKEPRSYDFDKTENKRYNERLRMPQFPFTAAEREAVITFVIGLVAEPPQPKYVFSAKDRNAALALGRQVLEKYNCGGCHILGLEKWQISYAPGEFGEREIPPTYPFLKPHFSPQELAAGAKPDRRNELHSTLAGLPPTEKDDGLPVVIDLDGSKLDNDAPYAEGELKLGLELLQPAIVDGSPYLTGQAPVFASKQQIDSRHPASGGVLTKYLLPVVTQLERKVNPNASGSEAYGWLPPPLVNEGNKVQTAWLHDFLLDPYPIRPAVFLRMPKFNMSSAEATALANYFAAVDNAEFPYSYSSGRDRSRLSALEAEYRKKGQGTGDRGQGTGSSEAPPDMKRLDDAMKIVVNGNFCVKCHLVGDFSPTGSDRAKAPQLADVYRRMRPDFVRDWIANPKMILPYTSMPVNIPYQNPPAVLGELFHGTNVEQIQALTDLLMNYDQYARQSTRIADRVVPAPAADGAAPATPTTGGGSN